MAMKPRRAWTLARATAVLAAGVMLAGGPAGVRADPDASDSAGLAKLSDRAAFRQFIEDFWPQAQSKGIARDLYGEVMRRLDPDPDVVMRNQNQAEFTTAIQDYVDKRVSELRIANGRARAADYAGDLEAIEKRLGVDRSVLVAIWGIESNYGSYAGDKSVLRSLATLAYDGPRRAYGRQQLLAALQILARGDVSADRFVGSWAGAMGHTQFIPTTFNAYAVDWTGDGRRDIWSSVPDALASSANYLAKRGWSPARPWGFEVTLPSGFDYRLVGEAGKRSFVRWAHLGVKVAGGGRFGLPREAASLLLPAGAAGPAFLVTDNFKAILAYNNSVAYALAVAHLADRLRGQGPLVHPWPSGQALLSKEERIEMQTLLTSRGFDTGGLSGYFGNKTQAAIQAYQRTNGLLPDGYATAELLERMRKDR
jgi:membrane-bound lytic murein transglycosylase B